jgi:predicted AlkP superfamily pyrophosphatase or phosphodiesterase
MATQRGRRFRAAKLFWWFNQGAAVDISVTPKPHYGADGNKVFGVTGIPEALVRDLERMLGPFPFRTFWGPAAGLPCTEWIARCAAAILARERPELTLVYLPHLDYDPQRFGPSGADMPHLVSELDAACAPIFDAARTAGARVWVVSEYGHTDVRRPIEINRVLRRAGYVTVRDGPFGEVLDTFQSRAFAVCDHQLAHVYVAVPDDQPRIRDLLACEPGIARILMGAERTPFGLVHPRAGELVGLSEPDAWFAYPYWLDARRAPDFARTVDIHRKPGYDPCELFFDSHRFWPRGRALFRLVQKKLGFRTLFDVIPLDPQVVRGSHGLQASHAEVQASHAEVRPILIGDGPAPERPDALAMTDVHGLLLRALVPQEKI